MWGEAVTERLMFLIIALALLVALMWVATTEKDIVVPAANITVEVPKDCSPYINSQVAYIHCKYQP